MLTRWLYSTCENGGRSWKKDIKNKNSSLEYSNNLPINCIVCYMVIIQRAAINTIAEFPLKQKYKIPLFD